MHRKLHGRPIFAAARERLGVSSVWSGFRLQWRTEITMKIHLTSAVAGLLLLGGAGFAVAQAVVIAPEQETVIREYVTTQKVDPVELPADVEVTVGATLPETVELHTLDVPDVNYQYVVVDGRTVLVEPDTRKIVHVME
jgi:hypothetical protein